MRGYVTNSSHAAARVVALTMLADGTLSRTELAMLFRLDLHRRLGIDSVEMQDLLEEVARDLYEFGKPWPHTGKLHPLLVKRVLEDVTDPRLQREVIELCHSMAECDNHLSDGEELVLELARIQWGLPSPILHSKGLA